MNGGVTVEQDYVWLKLWLKVEQTALFYHVDLKDVHVMSVKSLSITKSVITIVNEPLAHRRKPPLHLRTWSIMNVMNCYELSVVCISGENNLLAKMMQKRTKWKSLRLPI